MVEACTVHARVRVLAYSTPHGAPFTYGERETSTRRACELRTAPMQDRGGGGRWALRWRQVSGVGALLWWVVWMGCALLWWWWAASLGGVGGRHSSEAAAEPLSRGRAAGARVQLYNRHAWATSCVGGIFRLFFRSSFWEGNKKVTNTIQVSAPTALQYLGGGEVSKTKEKSYCKAVHDVPGSGFQAPSGSDLVGTGHGGAHARAFSQPGGGVAGAA